MGGLTILEQLCSVTMVLAGVGTFLLMCAGLALERQRQVLAGLQRERVRAYQYRREGANRRLHDVAWSL